MSEHDRLDKPAEKIGWIKCPMEIKLVTYRNVLDIILYLTAI